jgi:putative ATP-dependent endonuclease of OLD family
LVQGVLDQMTRAGHKQHTDIAFADPSFDALVRRLLSRLGEREAGDLFESGLGYQNLLYMAVLLAHLTEIERVPLRVLLVEEPEAHLHPQFQDLLLRYLQDSAGERAQTQVIVTSNSPQFAAAAELQRLVVLSRPGRQTQTLARQVADVDMTDLQRAHVRRFLDVTKAALFFARGVILVEGVSEQLLLPPFADQLGRDLADAGVSVINIGGVAFEPFVRLFAEDGLPIRCAVVSDGDADLGDPALEPSDRARGLQALQSTRVRTFLSTVTLEWDLAQANPGHEVLVEELGRLHPVNVAGLPDAADGAEAWATGFRSALTRKAEFAQNLAERIGPGIVLDVPDYLERAVAWVATPPEEREEEQPANEGSGEAGGNA